MGVGEVRHLFCTAAAAMLNSMDCIITLASANGRTVRHWQGGGGGGGLIRIRRRRGIFRDFICTMRGPGPSLLTRDDAVVCRGCLFYACDPSAAGARAGLGTSLATMTSAGGGRGGGAHKSELSLLSSDGSELSCHLHHIDAHREEAMEGLLLLLYNMVDDIFYRPDLERILIALG